MHYRVRTKPGLTLIEMTVVILTIALLVSLGLPAVRAFFNSFQSESAAKSMIGAALASARAMAARNQRYTGIRFQKACVSRDPLNPLGGLLGASQYMIFIVYEEPKKMGNLTVAFRAIEGLKPVKLPDTVGVIDLSLVSGDVELDEQVELADATTFSIIFSPSGRLIIHDVRVRNRQGVYQPNNDDPDTSKTATDDLFNSVYNIGTYGIGMFVQDDYPNLGLDREPSRNRLVIYDKQRFAKAYSAGRAWSDCLQRLVSQTVYVNAYTGTLVSAN